jgi:isopenicillin N synthase-like dioxygenase
LFAPIALQSGKELNNMVVPLSLPIVDLSYYFENPTSPQALEECRKAADALKTFGALLVRDHRVPSGANAEFIDLLEAYFEQPHDIKMQDVRSDLSYQIGATPEFTEEPVCLKDEQCVNIMNALEVSDKPTSWAGPDPKWRFFHRIGPSPLKTKYPCLNAPPVVPKAFEDRWLPIMDEFGRLLKDSVESVAELVAVGLNLPKNTFTDMAQFGPHLLAPTGSDLKRFNQLNTVFAGFHYDLNLLTIHGKSRFPGLHIWAR